MGWISFLGVFKKYAGGFGSEKMSPIQCPHVGHSVDMDMYRAFGYLSVQHCLPYGTVSGVSELSNTGIPPVPPPNPQILPEDNTAAFLQRRHNDQAKALRLLQSDPGLSRPAPLSWQLTPPFTYKTPPANPPLGPSNQGPPLNRNNGGVQGRFGG